MTKWLTIAALGAIAGGVLYLAYVYRYTAAVIPSEALIMSVYPVGAVWGLAVILCAWGAIAFWRRYKFLGVLPLLIAVTPFLLRSHVYHAGLARRAESFERLIPEYNEMVEEILSGSVPVEGKHEIQVSTSDRVIFRAHAEWKELAPYKIVVKSETNASQTIRFVMPASLIPIHHRTYMHRSDGVFEPYLWHERIERVVNTNWCMVRD